MKWCEGPSRQGKKQYGMRLRQVSKPEAVIEVDIESARIAGFFFLQRLSDQRMFYRLTMLGVFWVSVLRVQGFSCII